MLKIDDRDEQSGVLGVASYRASEVLQLDGRDEHCQVFSVWHHTEPARY